jgi:uncharacterized protein
MGIGRREFLEAAALGGIAAGALAGAEQNAAGMPLRPLGKTGATVSILALGGGMRFLEYTEEKGIEALQKALDLGISYIDTSDSYGNGVSEQRIGKTLGKRRGQIFLATKVTDRDGAQTARLVERSLKGLQTDRLDLIQIHSLAGEDDLARIEAKGGVLEQLQKLREQKLTRFIGITSHTDPATLKTALERHEFDVTQMPLNPALLGMKNTAKGMEPTDLSRASFEQVALPVAVRKKMGIVAMKVFAQDALTGKAPAEKLLSYSLSLPVTAAVVGMPKPEHIEQNARLAKAFRPLDAAEMRRFSEELVRAARPNA